MPVRLAVSTFRIKEWLFYSLAGMEIDDSTDEFPESFIKARNNLITKIFTLKKSEIEQYRDMIRNFVHEKNFSKYKKITGGMISNFLELLYHLKARGPGDNRRQKKCCY